MGHEDPTPWRAITGFDLHWRCWDNECVVFHSGTGDTHLLNYLAAEALQALQENPHTLMELTVRAARVSGVASNEELSQSMAELLNNMYRLGLIERVVR